MRYVFARSAYWAVLDRRATLAFESRYAIRLYELMSLRAGLTRKHEELFTLPELRARLGVPDGKLTRWVHLRQKALDPAVAEVNHLSPFAVSWTPVKHGRAVAAVRFSWRKKTQAARAEASAELAGAREGRRERRTAHHASLAEAGVAELIEAARAAGTEGGRAGSGSTEDARTSRRGTPDADAVPFGEGPVRPVPALPDRPSDRPSPRASRGVAPFPSHGESLGDAFPEGGIRYTRWAALVRAHAPKPTPDVELVAGAFRRFATERGIPLKGVRCERAFIGYCAKFQVR